MGGVSLLKTEEICICETFQQRDKFKNSKKKLGGQWEGMAVFECHFVTKKKKKHAKLDWFLPIIKELKSAPKISWSINRLDFSKNVDCCFLKQKQVFKCLVLKENQPQHKDDQSNFMKKNIYCWETEMSSFKRNKVSKWSKYVSINLIIHDLPINHGTSKWNCAIPFIGNVLTPKQTMATVLINTVVPWLTSSIHSVTMLGTQNILPQWIR